MFGVEVFDGLLFHLFIALLVYLHQLNLQTVLINLKFAVKSVLAGGKTVLKTVKFVSNIPRISIFFQLLEPKVPLLHHKIIIKFSV